MWPLARDEVARGGGHGVDRGVHGVTDAVDPNAEENASRGTMVSEPPGSSARQTSQQNCDWVVSAFLGALGAPGFLGQVFNRKKYEYHDVSLNQYIQNAYQALAIDERRKAFKPSIWERPAGWTGSLEQAWFAGVHSDVGGGYTPDGLANEALHWMVEKAERLGLEFDNAFLQHYRPCFNSVLHDSMSTMYRAMGAHVRPLGKNGTSGEVVHQSALDRLGLAAVSYKPSNLGDHVKTVGSTTTCNTTRVQRGVAC